MARKKKTGQSGSTVDYYKLKTQAVEDLVTADEENSPAVPQEELKKYRAGRGKGLPDWLKVNFIKFWFPAAVCYFFFWGLSLYIPSMLDLMFITGMALGAVTDLLTNNALRFFAETEGEHDKWMMFPKKKFVTLFQNIFYAMLLIFLVFCLYSAVNVALIALTGAPEDTVFLGVEPILFGVFYLLCDTLLLAVRNAVKGRWDRAKNKNA